MRKHAIKCSLGNSRASVLACHRSTELHHSLHTFVFKLSLSVQLIGGDPDKDVAVLQLRCDDEKLKELKAITKGASSNLLVGQKVYAIG